GGQVNIIPWDYNLAFGGMGGMSGMDGRNPETTRSAGEADPGKNADEAAENRTAGATGTVNDPIDDSWGSTSFFDVLLDNEEYNSRYHEYLQMLVDYVEGGRYEEVTKEIRSGIDELVRTDPTAFYTYEEYENACIVLDEVVDLRAQSIKGQLDGTIPSTSAGQREDSSSLIDASHINTSDMGTMKLNDFRSPVMI
ncbi:MAG: CotH kinase family protein, partial [Lachnospiraceae bacterium]|nr:CotH kinase family protein [Lachnospiraceae bacterium]